MPDSHPSQRERALYLLFAGADYYPSGGADDFIAGHLAASEEEACAWAETVDVEDHQWMHLAVVEGDALRIVRNWWRQWDYSRLELMQWESEPGSGIS